MNTADVRGTITCRTAADWPSTRSVYPYFVSAVRTALQRQVLCRRNLSAERTTAGRTRGETQLRACP